MAVPGSDKLKHVKRGDLPNAQQQNTLIDVAKRSVQGQGFSDSQGTYLRPQARRIITPPSSFQSLGMFADVYFAKVTTLVPGGDGGLDCRIFWHYNDDTGPPLVPHQDYWITPAADHQEVAYPKKGAGTFALGTLSPPLEEDDYIVVTGIAYQIERVELAAPDGKQRVWEGTLPHRPHPGHVAIEISEDPLVRSPWHTKGDDVIYQRVATSFFNSPDGDGDVVFTPAGGGDGWGMFFDGNTSGDREDSYCNMRGTYDYKVTWAATPKKGQKITLWYCREDEYQYTWVETATTPTVYAEVPGASAPIQLDKWYDVAANKAWFDIDTRDWSGRFIEIAVQYKPEHGNTAGIQWIETDVEHYNIDTAAWVGQITGEWFRTFFKDGGALQNMSRIVQVGDTDFHLQMAAGGALQIKTENRNADMQVRFWIRASEKILPAAAEALT